MAAQAYAHVLQDEPGHPKAVAGLARCYLKSGDVERAKTTLQLVRPDGASDEAIRAVEAELKLREQAASKAGETDALRAKLEADPKDHQARYDLAMALDGTGDREGAIEQLLEIVRRDRKWNEEAARKQLVTLFEAMGPTDPRTHRRAPQALLDPVLLRDAMSRYHNIDDLPPTLPVFPLSGVLLLPRGQLPLNVFEPRYLAMVDAALSGNRLIGMIQPAEREERR